jgi:hypothetical protein
MGTTTIKTERGIQWDRPQITVPAGPLYSYGVILQLEEYCSDKKPKLLTGKIM